MEVEGTIHTLGCGFFDTCKIPDAAEGTGAEEIQFSSGSGGAAEVADASDPQEASAIDADEREAFHGAGALGRRDAKKESPKAEREIDSGLWG